MSEATGWMIGFGIVTMALFPFALPGIALTVAAVIPLLLVGLAAALVAAIVAVPVLLIRALGRRASRAIPEGPPPASVPRSS